MSSTCEKCGYTPPKRTKKVMLRATAEESARWMKEAKSAGYKTLSDYLRALLEGRGKDRKG